jgi:hypothetical protein
MKPKTCKICKDKFEPQRALQMVCSFGCSIEYTRKQKDKDWAKRKQVMKKELLTKSDYIKLAQQVFNKYIRLRDKGQVCISCQKECKKENAGHFHNANNHWAVRFDENNVHLQCEHCNTYLSGNLNEYRTNLINKIGIANFELLQNKAKHTRKFTIEELKQIIETYKQKTKT